MGCRGESRQGPQLGTLGIINTLDQTKEAISWKAGFILDLNELWCAVGRILSDHANNNGDQF